MNNLFLIPVRANFLLPSVFILLVVVEYLSSDNIRRRVYIVGIVFKNVNSFTMTRGYNPGIPDPGIPVFFTPGLNPGIVSQSRIPCCNPGIPKY